MYNDINNDKLEFFRFITGFSWLDATCNDSEAMMKKVI